MHIGTYFSACHPTLNDLSIDVLKDIKQIILSHRDGVSSVCVVVNSLNALERIIQNVPTEIQHASTRRYGVDLSSISTSKLRLYIDSNIKGESIIGFYFDENNNVIEKKHYKKDPKNIKTIFVDRYNAEGIIISSDEPEYQSDRSCWRGSTEWADLADASPYEVRYMYKGNKPQSYIYIQGRPLEN
jgi:hypothetical protein